MAGYEFVTIWRVEAPIDKVWDAIYRSEDWPRWWKGVENVEELRKGDDAGVGSVRRYTWKSALPYRLVLDMTVTRVERPSRLEGTAVGELEGTGTWSLTADGAITTARYDWVVKTTKAWMNVLAPIARPLFSWNHDVVMRQGGQGLARLLGTSLR
ncbi:MAG: SRPBCC family protein [Acidobacteriota bacterium]